jgi:hypothetical protein
LISKTRKTENKPAAHQVHFSRVIPPTTTRGGVIVVTKLVTATTGARS